MSTHPMSSHNSGTKSGVAKPGVIPNVDILRFSDDEYRIDQCANPRLTLFHILVSLNLMI